MVEGVEKLRAELELGALGYVEGTRKREIQGLHAGAVDGVAAHITEGEGGRRGERQRG